MSDGFIAIFSMGFLMGIVATIIVMVLGHDDE